MSKQLTRPGTYLLWLVLALPGIFGLQGFFRATITYDNLMHSTGEFAIRFLVIALLITPFMRLWPSRQWSQWLRRHRRHFGVAACVYAVLHTFYYLNETATLSYWVDDLSNLAIWTGWVATLIFIVLGLTSNDFSVAKLGKRWFTLHKLVYIVALFSALHWYLLSDHIGVILIHFVPVIVFELLRWRQQQNKVANDL